MPVEKVGFPGFDGRKTAEDQYLRSVVKNRIDRMGDHSPAPFQIDLLLFYHDLLFPSIPFHRSCFFEIKKKHHPKMVLLFWCGRWDLNPHARAHAPQTCLSANSSTAAIIIRSVDPEGSTFPVASSIVPFFHAIVNRKAKFISPFVCRSRDLTSIR